MIVSDCIFSLLHLYTTKKHTVMTVTTGGESVLNEIGDGRIVKMEEDFSKKVDAAIPDARKLAKVIFYIELYIYIYITKYIHS